MATEYQVGPDDPGIPNEPDFIWIVHWYEIGDYCGDGEAIGLHKDGFLYTCGLSHCSCYGPCDDGMATKK